MAREGSGSVQRPEANSTAEHERPSSTTGRRAAKRPEPTATALYFDWGLDGARAAARGGALVVVDVLTFSTAVTIMTGRGSTVYPHAFPSPDIEAFAEARGAAWAVGRREVSSEHPWSLSPADLVAAPAVDRLVLPSPNGSAISAAAAAAVARDAGGTGGAGGTSRAGRARKTGRTAAASSASRTAAAGRTAVAGSASRTAAAGRTVAAGSASRTAQDGNASGTASPPDETSAGLPVECVVAGCLRNASAVAEWLEGEGYGTPDRPVTVIAAGERWPDGELRPALEDLLGAAAIISAMDGHAIRSPEAAVAEVGWFAHRHHAAEFLRECYSGRELTGRGYAADVALAAEHDAQHTVPLLVDGAFRGVA